MPERGGKIKKDSSLHPAEVLPRWGFTGGSAGFARRVDACRAAVSVKAKGAAIAEAKPAAGGNHKQMVTRCRAIVNRRTPLGRTHFQVWGKPNHLGGGSGVAR